MLKGAKTQSRIEMKIAVKKKYVGAAAGFVSFVLGITLLQELWIQISLKPLSALVTPLIFVFSTIYAISHHLSLKSAEKLADEVSQQVTKGDPDDARLVKKHLLNKTNEEAYTLNFFMGKVRFTSSWGEQDKIEKLKSSKHIPDIVRKELV